MKRLAALHLPVSAPMWLGIALYAFTAWRSEGYHHPDEHFQILEFAHHKLGRTPAAALPWEFAAQIRPGLQPMLAYGFIRAAEAAGLSSPFNQIFLLRLLTGWLCLWAFFRWAHWLSSTSGDERLGRWLRWAVALGWFVPYLSVRFSSENWAGLLFSAGLLLLLPLPYPTPRAAFFSGGKRRSWVWFAAAFFLIISFFFRFQMAFALMGLGAWLLWRWRADTSLRPTWAQAAGLVAGSAAALALGFAADAWMYGKPVFTAYNYFAANILENKAAHWGTSPWWYYFGQTALSAVPPLSLLLLLFLGLGMWHQRRSVLAWSFLPFLLAHMAVGHKEMRFMFPMLLPALVLAVQGASIGAGMLRQRGKARVVFRAVFWVAVVINGLLLPVRCLLAAQEAVPTYRFLYQYAAERAEPVAVFSQEKNVYGLVGLEVHFYRSPSVQTFVVQRFDPGTLRLASTPHHLLFSPKLMLQNLPPTLQTKRVFTYLPDGLLRFNPNDWQGRTRMWSLHEVAH
jgi:GPI mannosyltransferase 3